MVERVKLRRHPSAGPRACPVGMQILINADPFAFGFPAGT